MLGSIDGVDISTIGLEDLRTRIVSPNTRVIVSTFLNHSHRLLLAKMWPSSKEVRILLTCLFRASTNDLVAVRSNLDPFDEHSDQECWDVLRRCHLAASHTAEERSQPAKRVEIESLDALIAVGGGSLSAGQRQLLALARAMLRRTQVVLTDEATSAIDLDLDDRVRTTIYRSTTCSC